MGEGILFFLRFRLERFRFSLVKRKPQTEKFFHPQGTSQILLKEKDEDRKKLKKCIEKISVLVHRNTAGVDGNTPTELPIHRSVRESLELPCARHVISRGSV